MMDRKSTFNLLGNALSRSFFKQLILFLILAVAVFAVAFIIFPDLSTRIAAEIAASEIEDGPFYMGFYILVMDVKSMITLAVGMMICAMCVSPLACGTAAMLNDACFSDRGADFGKCFGLALKNYLRLVTTYILYVLIAVGMFGIFAFFMYNFMHEWSHVYVENFMIPVMIGWIALILFVLGGIIFSPFVSVYEKKGGFKSIGGSFVLFIKGGFLHNMLQLLIGAVVWAVIVIVPAYAVLMSMCGPGESIESLLYVIDIPGNSPGLWIIMIVSWAVATLFMFDYSQAVFFGAAYRKKQKDEAKLKQKKKEEEIMEYQSYRNNVWRRQTGHYR